ERHIEGRCVGIQGRERPRLHDGEPVHATTDLECVAPRIIVRITMKQHDRRFLLPYLDMIEDFLHERISEEELQRVYMESYLGETTPMDPEGSEYTTLNEFFLDLEDYVEDPSLRRADDFDEAELRRRAERARGEIRQLLSDGPGDLPAA
ncbi:MAG TPA: colicin immunity domain-containing protein, partial [Acetobacteraceae bacterium]|nr:colicin immunity domain-containing protein [Acetobacteraceae bacterium]